MLIQVSYKNRFVIAIVFPDATSLVVDVMVMAFYSDSFFAHLSSSISLYFLHIIILKYEYLYIYYYYYYCIDEILFQFRTKYIRKEKGKGTTVRSCYLYAKRLKKNNNKYAIIVVRILRGSVVTFYIMKYLSDIFIYYSKCSLCILCS